MQPFEVLPDPRLQSDPAQNAAKQALLGAIKADTVAMLDAVQSMKAARASLQASLADPSVARSGKAKRAGQAIDKKLERWLDLTVEINDRHFVDPSHSSERLDFNLLSVLAMVDTMDPPLTAGLIQRVGDVRAEWTRRRSEHEALLGEVTAFRRQWPTTATASLMR